jgi:hypothetical protein
MSAVKQAFDALSNLTDIFNLGRLVFYTAAGALLVYPAVAAISVLSGPELGGRPFDEFVSAFEAQVAGTNVALVAASIVVGFLISAVGFTRVLGTASTTAKAKAEASPVDRRSYPFRYPQLKGTAAGGDYDSWLIHEYFRFVEIVTYVPLGLLGGLASVTLYAAAYVVFWSAAGHGTAFAAPHLALISWAALFAFAAYGVWPRFWIPRVVEPVLEAYHRTKLAVVTALDERKPAPAAAAAAAAEKP